MNWKNFVCSVVCLAGMTCAEAVNYTPENVSASIALKVPGNDAKRYPLTLQQLDNSNFEYQWVAADKLPVVIYQNVEEKDGNQRIVIFMTALDDVYFNFGEQVMTGCHHDDCLFYMPGFWYRRNLRSPQEAPSFHTSDSWLVREGWNISVPSITLDTRWGVPRYDQSKETETYLVSGSMLSTMDDNGQMGVAHRCTL